jgi:hypothetical protein
VSVVRFLYPEEILTSNPSKDLKAQLSQERDNLRHVSLQKDMEVKELQSRIDKTVRPLSPSDSERKLIVVLL